MIIKKCDFNSDCFCCPCLTMLGVSTYNVQNSKSQYFLNQNIYLIDKLFFFVPPPAVMQIFKNEVSLERKFCSMD